MDGAEAGASVTSRQACRNAQLANSGCMHCVFFLFTSAWYAVLKDHLLKLASFLLRNKQKTFHSQQYSSCPRCLPPSIWLFSLYPAAGCTWAWMARAGQAAARALSCREREVGRRGGGAQILMRCAVSMATLTEEGKKKRVLSLSLHSPLLCAPSSSSFSLLPSSPAGEGLCKAPDDTPDAPTQQPLSATFTSLP